MNIFGSGCHSKVARSLTPPRAGAPVASRSLLPRWRTRNIQETPQWFPPHGPSASIGHCRLINGAGSFGANRRAQTAQTGAQTYIFVCSYAIRTLFVRSSSFFVRSSSLFVRSSSLFVRSSYHFRTLFEPPKLQPGSVFHRSLPPPHLPPLV